VPPRLSLFSRAPSSSTSERLLWSRRVVAFFSSQSDVSFQSSLSFSDIQSESIRRTPANSRACWRDGDCWAWRRAWRLPACANQPQLELAKDHHTNRLMEPPERCPKGRCRRFRSFACHEVHPPDDRPSCDGGAAQHDWLDEESFKHFIANSRWTSS
jgi:hypothetical protein